MFFATRRNLIFLDYLFDGGKELGLSHIVGKHSATKPSPEPLVNFSMGLLWHYIFEIKQISI